MVCYCRRARGLLSTSAEPVIDIVVITFESAKHLPVCLASVPDPSRVLVIDNGSLDDSAEIAQQFGCRVIRNDVNLGFARAANQAISETESPFVLLLNPDAALEPASLDHLQLAMRDSGVAIAGGRLLHDDGTEQQPWWPFPTAARAWREALRISKPTWRADAEATARDVDFVVGACLLLRRSAVQQVGGFDERFWLYGEEADLCKRLRDIGWRVRFVPAAVTNHVGGASGGSLGSSVSTHFSRGSERFVLHHQGRPALMMYRLGVLVGSALRLAVMQGRGEHESARLQTRTALVKHLSREVRRNPMDVPVVPQGKTECLVLCSLEAWDDVWRRNQFLVKELVDRTSVRTRVLFVEPPNDVLHQFRRLGRPGRMTPSTRLAPDQPGVTLFQPVKWLPRVLGGFADRSLQRQVRRATAAVGFTDHTLWINDSTYVGLAEQSTVPVLYDITDDWTREAVAQRERDLRLDREVRMLARADSVVVCSAELAEDRGRYRTVELIPNAVDTAHFQRPQPRPFDLPIGQTAVYVGSIQRERFDVALTAEVADRHRDLHIVLVGPDCLTDQERSLLTTRGNIHILGPRPYQNVPAYLQHADVIIVPHVVSPFTESLDPIKAYECVAVGRPTVSTPVAGFRNLAYPIVIADTAHFADAVGQVLASPHSTCPGVGVPSWRTRADAFACALDQARSTNPAPAPRRRRVVFIGHTAKQSGAELALVRLLPGLADTDAHVILAENGPLVGLLERAGADVTVLPMDARTRDTNRANVRPGLLPLTAAWHALTYTVRLAHLLRKERPDLVHTNTLKASLYGGAAARLARVPLVWHVRDRIANDYMPATTARSIRFLARWLPHGIIANSMATQATLSDGKHQRTKDCTVVYDPLPTVPNLGATGAEVTIGIVGRLSPWKGQDLFLRAFAQAFPGGAERALIVGSAMFGEDAYAVSLDSLIDELGLRERVTLVGFTEDVWPVLASLTVLVHASTLPEPFGQVVLEGLAAGVPVIASNAGGPAEIITHEVNGILVAPNDVAALAKAMCRLANDTDLQIRLRDAGRQRAADFTAAELGSQVTRFYDRVLDKSNA